MWNFSSIVISFFVEFIITTNLSLSIHNSALTLLWHFSGFKSRFTNKGVKKKLTFYLICSFIEFFLNSIFPFYPSILNNKYCFIFYKIFKIYVLLSVPSNQCDVFQCSAMPVSYSFQFRCHLIFCWISCMHLHTAWFIFKNAGIKI